MEEQVKRAAWSLGLWGAISVIFGVLILAWPSITLKAFLVVLGVYLLAAGAMMLLGSLISREGHWVGGALIGVISAVAGIYVFSHPKITTLAVLTVIAIWAIVVGVLHIVAGFESGKQGWWLIISGLIFTLFGFYVFANPKGGALATIWLIGLSVIAGGVVSLIASFKIGDMQRQISRR